MMPVKINSIVKSSSIHDHDVASDEIQMNVVLACESVCVGRRCFLFF